MAKHISRVSGRPIHESSLRQWEQGSVPSQNARRHFADGAHGGTYNGIPDAEEQDFDTVLARLERAIGSLSNQPGPEITEAWTRLPPRMREAKNLEIEAIVAALEDALRAGRAQADAEAEVEARRPRVVPPPAGGPPAPRRAARA